MTGAELAALATVMVEACCQEDIEAVEVLDLKFAMPQPNRVRGGCVFLMHPQTRGAVLKLKDHAGVYLAGWWPDNIGERLPAWLVGHPIREDETMPMIRRGARSVLFVDFGTADGVEPVGPVLCLEHPKEGRG
jgi:HK97 family phage major capsid protein